MDFDEQAAKEHVARMQETKQSLVQIEKACGCPGANAKTIDRSTQNRKLPVRRVRPVGIDKLAGADQSGTRECAVS